MSGTSEWENMLGWRGIEPEDACEECGGSGVIIYGTTATYHGGAGGTTLTQGVCDKCWGSGDKTVKWPSHRSFYWMERELRRVKDQLKEFIK